MVAWHQDSAYISANFLPEADNSATVWIALDDAGPAFARTEYRQLLHQAPLKYSPPSAPHPGSGAGERRMESRPTKRRNGLNGTTRRMPRAIAPSAAPI